MDEIGPVSIAACIVHFIFLGADLFVKGNDSPASMPRASPLPNLASAGDMILVSALLHIVAILLTPWSYTFKRRFVRAAIHSALFVAFTVWFCTALYIFCFSVGRTPDFGALIIIDYFVSASFAVYEVTCVAIIWYDMRVPRLSRDVEVVSL